MHRSRYFLSNPGVCNLNPSINMLAWRTNNPLQKVGTMHNSSIFVSDPNQNLYALGYRHGGEAVTAIEIIESALSANKDNEVLTPREFLAEWHRLNLNSWDNPSGFTVQAIEHLDDIADRDSHHFEVELHEGRVVSVRGVEAGKETFHLSLPA